MAKKMKVTSVVSTKKENVEDKKTKGAKIRKGLETVGEMAMGVVKALDDAATFAITYDGLSDMALSVLPSQVVIEKNKTQEDSENVSGK